MVIHGTKKCPRCTVSAGFRKDMDCSYPQISKRGGPIAMASFFFKLGNAEVLLRWPEFVILGETGPGF